MQMIRIRSKRVKRVITQGTEQQQEEEEEEEEEEQDAEALRS